VFFQARFDAFAEQRAVLAIEVATIGNGLEFIDAKSFLGLASDVCQLRSI
jgi:hypothetical protein